jgi:hypothetical protein
MIEVERRRPPRRVRDRATRRPDRVALWAVLLALLLIAAAATSSHAAMRAHHARLHRAAVPARTSLRRGS